MVAVENGMYRQLSSSVRACPVNNTYVWTEKYKALRRGTRRSAGAARPTSM